MNDVMAKFRADVQKVLDQLKIDEDENYPLSDLLSKLGFVITLETPHGFRVQKLISHDKPKATFIGFGIVFIDYRVYAPPSQKDPYFVTDTLSFEAWKNDPTALTDSVDALLQKLLLEHKLLDEDGKWRDQDYDEMTADGRKLVANTQIASYNSALDEGYGWDVV